MEHSVVLLVMTSDIGLLTRNRRERIKRKLSTLAIVVLRLGLRSQTFRNLGVEHCFVWLIGS